MTTLNEIIRRHRAASSGEWRATTPENPSGKTVATTGVTWRERPSIYCSVVRCPGEGNTTDRQANDDAEFIAHAKTHAIPWLVKELISYREAPLLRLFSENQGEEIWDRAAALWKDIRDDLLPIPDVCGDRSAVHFMWTTDEESLTIDIDEREIAWKCKSWHDITVRQSHSKFDLQVLLRSVNEIIRHTF